MNKAITRLLSLLSLVVASCCIIYILDRSSSQQSARTSDQLDAPDSTTLPHDQSPKVFSTNLQDLNDCSTKGQAQAPSCSTTKETPSSKSYIKVVVFIAVCLLIYVLYKNIGGEKAKEPINSSTSSISKPNTTVSYKNIGGEKAKKSINSSASSISKPNTIDTEKALIEQNIYKKLSRLQREKLVHGFCSKLRACPQPRVIYLMISFFVYGNHLQYKNNKTLPDDLSGQDLCGYDFTGCAFTHTNLTYTNLADVILTNTTCDYQQAFLDNMKKNGENVSDYYKENLPKELKSIAMVYPKLNNNTHKAKLLQVASTFSQLPFCEYKELHIKLEYWSSELYQLKQVLDYTYRRQLVCLLKSDLEDDANNSCWTTKYPQDKVNIEGKALHANFDTYLKEFTDGLTKYQCKSINNDDFDYYKKEITLNIKGLGATYPHIKEKELQLEACAIADALSKSYQMQNHAFLHHYLFYQHRLIRLKKSVGTEVRNEVYYNSMCFFTD